MAGVAARSGSTNQNHNWIYLNSNTKLVLKPSHLLFFPSSINFTLTSSSSHLRRSFCGSPFNHNHSSFSRFHAGTSSPPPSEDEFQTKGIAATFFRFRDKLQIFIAVFIWMSLFFWASASDRNNIGGTKKGGRFRK